jgi:predicted metal-binding membrane protein
MSADVDASALERLLRRDRRLMLVSLALLSVLAWSYLVLVATRMARGDMRLMGMGDMSAMVDALGNAAMTSPVPWAASTFALMVLMWWIMMMGMMLPSAAPMVLLYGRLQRRQLAHEQPALRTASFVAGYLVVWGAFSAIATLAQWGLGSALLISPMRMDSGPGLGAVLFLAAGLYQLSPFKDLCLRRCRSPAEFLSTYWRKGTRGAFVMGAVHGAFCVGCCWLLMALLFFGGVMNLAWVALIGVFVLLEKILPRGQLFARASGAALLAFAAYLAAAPFS